MTPQLLKPVVKFAPVAFREVCADEVSCEGSSQCEH